MVTGAVVDAAEHIFSVSSCDHCTIFGGHNVYLYQCVQVSTICQQYNTADYYSLNHTMIQGNKKKPFSDTE